MILKYLYISKYPVVVIYDGESQLTNERIICFMYLKSSSNSKVKGAYYTVYVPYDAETNHHQSVCGDCALKPFCFTKGYMQMSYYKWLQKYKEGKIPKIEVEDLKDFNVLPSLFRFGMHGDPASIPYSITEKYLKFWEEKKVTVIGYTHQKEHENYDSRYDIFLTSIESLTQKDRIKHKTSRVIYHPKEKAKDEVICPYDLEKEKNGYTTITCGECRLCSIDKNINIAFLPKKPSNNFITFLKHDQQDSRVPNTQSSPI